MVRTVCIDSDVFIDIIRDGERTKNMDLTNCKIFTTAINVFELLNRRNNREEMKDLLENLDVLPFGDDEAEEAAKIHLDLIKKGKTLDFRDIFIAAIVKQSNSELLTFNKKHFENIKGLKLF